MTVTGRFDHAADIEGTAATLVRLRLEEAISAQYQTLRSECVPQAAAVARRIVGCLQRGGKVFFFGNGGSSTDAQHLAAELLGRFYVDRPGLAAICLSDNMAAMTAIANDYSYHDVFARQLRGLGSQGDVAIGLTTSGNSANVVAALQAGREMGLFTVAMTGSRGGLAESVVDVCIKVASDDTPRIQEVCMHLGHTICEIVESELFGP